MLVELAARMQAGEDDLDGGDPLFGMQAHRNPATIILDPDAAIGHLCDHDARRWMMCNGWSVRVYIPGR